MVEACARPICGRVTNRAISRETGLDVVRIRRACEICLVASVASGRKGCKVVACVTRIASHGGVRARQRERCFRVIEGCACPGRCCVALRAVRREGGGSVVWIRGAGVIGLVASVAVSR